MAPSRTKNKVLGGPTRSTIGVTSLVGASNVPQAKIQLLYPEMLKIETNLIFLIFFIQGKVSATKIEKYKINTFLGRITGPF